MNSPAVELPDPLNPPSADAPGRADDLLAQMAGDEINRLLADAQVETEQPAPVSAQPEHQASTVSNDVLDLPGEMNATPVPQETISKELDQVFARQVSATGEPSTAAPSADSDRVIQGDAMSADGVTDLLGRLSAGERIEAPGLTGAGTAAAVQRSDAPHAVVANSPASHGVGNAGDSVPSPHQSVAAFAANAGAQALGPGAVAEVHPLASEPHSSRVIDWITYPLDPFPGPIRDVIGKVAIMTAINAAAVLLYVLVFRR